MGSCFKWAWIVHLLDTVPKAELYTMVVGGGHAFVKIGGKYYDPEVPNGVGDWRDLPAFQDGAVYEDEDVVHQSPTQFQNFWNQEGYEPNFKSLAALASKVYSH